MIRSLHRFVSLLLVPTLLLEPLTTSAFAASFQPTAAINNQVRLAPFEEEALAGTALWMLHELLKPARFMARRMLDSAGFAFETAGDEASTRAYEFEDKDHVSGRTSPLLTIISFFSRRQGEGATGDSRKAESLLNRLNNGIPNRESIPVLNKRTKKLIAQMLRYMPDMEELAESYGGNLRNYYQEYCKKNKINLKKTESALNILMAFLNAESLTQLSSFEDLGFERTGIAGNLLNRLVGRRDVIKRSKSPGQKERPLPNIYHVHEGLSEKTVLTSIFAVRQRPNHFAESFWISMLSSLDGRGERLRSAWQKMNEQYVSDLYPDDAPTSQSDRSPKPVTRVVARDPGSSRFKMRMHQVVSQSDLRISFETDIRLAANGDIDARQRLIKAGFRIYPIAAGSSVINPQYRLVIRAMAKAIGFSGKRYSLLDSNFFPHGRKANVALEVVANEMSINIRGHGQPNTTGLLFIREIEESGSKGLEISAINYGRPIKDLYKTLLTDWVPREEYRGSGLRLEREYTLQSDLDEFIADSGGQRITLHRGMAPEFEEGKVQNGTMFISRSFWVPPDNSGQTEGPQTLGMNGAPVWYWVRQHPLAAIVAVVPCLVVGYYTAWSLSTLAVSAVVMGLLISHSPIEMNQGRRSLFSHVAGIATALAMPLMPAFAKETVYISQPLSFPAMPAPLTADVLQRVKALDEATRKFQNQMLRINTNGTVEIIPTTDAEFLKIKTVYEQTISDILWPAVMELKNRQLLTPKELDVISQVVTRSKEMQAAAHNADILLCDVFPAYFARYGLYFYTIYSAVNGKLIPNFSLSHVLHGESNQAALQVYKDPIPYRIYTLGKSQLSTLIDLSPALPPSVDVATRYGTNQVFIKDQYLKRTVQKDLALFDEIIRKYPSIQSGLPFTLSQDPNPVHRAWILLFINSLKDLTGEPTAMPSRAAVEQAISSMWSGITPRHEGGHVHDGIRRMPIPRTGGLISEVRAAVGSMIGFKGASYMTAVLLGLSLVVPDSALGVDEHASDYIFMRNRLAFWLWKDREVQRLAGVSIPEYSGRAEQFSDLPAGIHAAIWEAFPKLKDPQWWALYQHIWDEIQGPDSPLLLGLDVQPVTEVMAVNKPAVPAVLRPSPTSTWRDLAGVGILAAIFSGIIVLLLEFRNRARKVMNTAVAANASRSQGPRAGRRRKTRSKDSSAA